MGVDELAHRLLFCCLTLKVGKDSIHLSKYDSLQALQKCLNGYHVFKTSGEKIKLNIKGFLEVRLNLQMWLFASEG